MDKLANIVNYIEKNNKKVEKLTFSQINNAMLCTGVMQALLITFLKPNVGVVEITTKINLFNRSSTSSKASMDIFMV